MSEEQGLSEADRAAISEMHAEIAQAKARLDEERADRERKEAAAAERERERVLEARRSDEQRALAVAQARVDELANADNLEERWIAEHALDAAKLAIIKPRLEAAEAHLADLCDQDPMRRLLRDKPVTQADIAEAFKKRNALAALADIHEGNLKRRAQMSRSLALLRQENLEREQRELQARAEAKLEAERLEAERWSEARRSRFIETGRR